MLAAEQMGHHAILNTLAEAGAEVNVTDDDGDTPIGMAISEGHAEVVELLRAAGATE